VVVWQTRNDEVTCTDLYPVPWGGEVNGCRDMHGRVISAGPYLGMSLSEAETLAAENAVEGPTTEDATLKLGRALDRWEAGKAQGKW